MKRKALQRMITEQFEGDGRVKYDQRNPIARAVVDAGERSQEIGYSRHRPSDERDPVEAAIAKRERKAAKRLKDWK